MPSCGSDKNLPLLMVRLSALSVTASFKTIRNGWPLSNFESWLNDEKATQHYR